MKSRFRLIAIGVAAGLAAVLGSPPGVVPSPAALETLYADTLSLCPDSTWKSENEIFDVAVCIPAGITNLMGYDVAVTFDSSVIEILNVKEGPLPKSAPSTFFQWLNPEGPADSVHVNGALFGHTVDGPGDLFTLTFKGLHDDAVTTTNICIAYSALRDGANHDIGHERKCGFVEISAPTGVGSPRSEAFGLECFPNPFNPAITLVLSLPERGRSSCAAVVSLGVYAPDGRLVRSLFDGNAGPGEKRFVWDGRNENGEEVSSGVYFAAANTEAGTLKTKLVLVR
jgi:hypothetical protein